MGLVYLFTFLYIYTMLFNLILMFMNEIFYNGMIQILNNQNILMKTQSCV
jgi:hypothetical protein